MQFTPTGVLILAVLGSVTVANPLGLDGANNGQPTTVVVAAAAAAATTAQPPAVPKLSSVPSSPEVNDRPSGTVTQTPNTILPTPSSPAVPNTPNAAVPPIAAAAVPSPDGGTQESPAKPAPPATAVDVLSTSPRAEVLDTSSPPVPIAGDECVPPKMPVVYTTSFPDVSNCYEFAPFFYYCQTNNALYIVNLIK